MNLLRRSADVPLYRQLKRLLVAQVAGRSPHARIPGELELARRHGVSRATVQEALKELVAEGLLYRVQGKGTFVSPPRILRSFSDLPSYSEDIRKRGLVPGVTHLKITCEEPPDTIQAALQLGPTESVWRIRRVRTGSGEPVALVVSYVPVRLLPKLSEDDVRGSLYEAMKRHLGARPEWAEDTYHAESAGPEEARFLDLPVGSPILVSERITYLAEERPVEYVYSYIRGDRFTISVTINRRPLGPGESVETRVCATGTGPDAVTHGTSADPTVGKGVEQQ